MARLAEASVVIALRDWQWMHRMAHDQFPDRYLALSGNAERKLGDAFLRHGERIFLFELKSTRSNINDEWTPVALKSGKTRPKKSAHRWASRLAKRLLKHSLGSATDYDLLVKSLQGHHFVYWSSHIISGLSASGHLMMEPYFLGTLKRCQNMEWGSLLAILNHKFATAETHPSVADDPPNSIRYKLREPLALDAIDGCLGRLMELVKTNRTYTWRHLGLPLDEFQLYVNALCGGLKGSEHINAVVMSSQGSFFAHVTSTDQLRTIFDEPLPGELVQRREQTRDDGHLPLADRAKDSEPAHRGPSGSRRRRG